MKNRLKADQIEVSQSHLTLNRPLGGKDLKANEADELRQYIQAASSDNTRKAYRSAIRQFEKWGGRLPTNRDIIVRYILNKAEHLNPRTIDLHLTAISQWHIYQEMSDPTRDLLVRKAMLGVRRTHSQPKQKAKALRLEHLAKMLNHLRSLPSTNKKYRDIALVLIGFFGAFRRSELVNIQINDLTWEHEGLIITLPRSKTDHNYEGIQRAIPFGHTNACPVMAIKDWIDKAGIKEGPVFRPINRWGQIQEKALNPSAINEFLKSLGTMCDFDFIPQLSSHSFRRGFSTTAARENVAFDLIKKQGGWRNEATVREYIDEGQQLSENATIPLMNKLSDLL